MAFEAHGSVQGNPSPQPVSTPSASPAPVATPTPAAAPTVPSVQAPVAQPASSGQSPALDPAAPPAPYTPNYKFKVMDKEHEIPEHFRGVIKDAESEKMAREIFEKAYGLDVVKPRFNEVREKYKQVSENHNQVMKGISDIRELYQAGDFDGFFQKLNVPVEKVLQWVIDKAQYNELPPEQRNVLDARKRAEKEAFDLRKQNQTLEHQYEDALTQARDHALQVTLAKPDVRTFAENFDSKGFKKSDGTPVTFIDAVIETGEYAWYSSKGQVDLSPEQAVQEVMSRYGAAVQPQQLTSPPIIPVQGAPDQGNTQGVATKRTQTLPNIAGRGTSSVAKTKPRSLDDLKKMAAQMGS